MSLKAVSTAVLSSGTFAAKPASPAAGTLYYATNLGTGGMLLNYNGTKWQPVGGVGVLYHDVAYNSVTTVGTSEVNIANYKIPAGLLSSAGCLRIFAEAKYSGTAGSKTGILRHTTSSGSTSGGTLIYSNLNGGSATALSGTFYKMIHNTATNAQVIQPTNSNQAGGTAGSAGVATGAIDTTADTYLNFNMSENVSGDTIGYQGVTIEWIDA